MPESGNASEPSCADEREPGVLHVAEARQKILEGISPLTGHQRLDLRRAVDRILSEAVVSPINVPAHTNSAMDGYALAATALPEHGKTELRVVGTAYAGGGYQESCGPGECVRIMTGATIPDGTDTVVMQEQIERLDEHRIRIGDGHRGGQNVRQAGEDLAAGHPAIAAGRRLTASDIGVLASLGIGEVAVQRRPRVAFFSTGDELRSIGEPLAEGQIYDSNRYSLHAMLLRCGAEALDLGVVRDEPTALREALTSAAGMADMVITSGGVSVGEADYVKSVLEELGHMEFWKIAMKPGRPLTHGRIGESLFFGLPGNPVAVMVTFYQFVLPALQRLAGNPDYQPFTLPARSTGALRKRPGRYEFVRGILGLDAEGPTVSSTGRQGSGILTSMSRANCFILLPEDNAGVEAGELVEVQPFAALI